MIREVTVEFHTEDSFSKLKKKKAKEWSDFWREASGGLLSWDSGELVQPCAGPVHLAMCLWPIFSASGLPSGCRGLPSSAVFSLQWCPYCIKSKDCNVWLVDFSRSVVLQLESTSESPEGLVKSSVLGPNSRASDPKVLGEGLKICFLASSKDMLLMLAQGPPLRTTGLLVSIGSLNSLVKFIIWGLWEQWLTY